MSTFNLKPQKLNSSYEANTAGKYHIDNIV